MRRGAHGPAARAAATAVGRDVASRPQERQTRAALFSPRQDLPQIFRLSVNPVRLSV